VPAIGVIAVIGLGLAGVLWIIAYLALHPRAQSLGQTPADPYGMVYREISFKTADGLVLRGWYLPGHNGATVVLVHGYARDRTELLPEARMLVDLGYSVILFDTRAQGASDGAHIGIGYLETLDVRAAVDFALEQSPQTQIGVMGYSIGAVAALQAAAEDTRIRAVIAVSPFASLRDTVRHRLKRIQPLAPLLVWWGERMTGLDLDVLRPVDVVARVAPRPLLIMQGEDDQMVPADSGQRLFATALEPKELWSVPGVAHVDFRQAVPEAYRHKVIGFFERFLPPLD
jgi:dipeptidyl aminopeptidase/acylaminoacyl peptidase